MPINWLSRGGDLLLAERPQNAPVRENLASLPAIQPGQIWLVELSPEFSPSGIERRILEAADIVIYDHSLAGTVDEILPLGSYAEPTAESDGPPDPAVIDRCMRLARDGWSVVRAIAAEGDVPRRAARQRAFAARCQAERGDGQPAMRAFGAALGGNDAAGRAGERTITVFAASAAMHPSPIAANGLAG